MFTFAVKTCFVFEFINVLVILFLRSYMCIFSFMCIVDIFFGILSSVLFVNNFPAAHHLD